MEDMSNKVSVIVPVYNVERYLKECITSIVNQTYNNLEIILVDDGAKDRSGDICDQFAAMDSRVKVIHQINGGVSTARNTGIENATGNFISFIDSDDFLEVSLYDDVMNIFFNNTDVDIIAFSAQRVKGGKIISHKCSGEITFETGRSALMKNLSADGACVWNKVYRRKVVEKIRFPEGRVFEDSAVEYRLYINANKVARLDKILYNYRYNDNSITQSAFNPKARWDYVIANEELFQYCVNSEPECVDIRRAFLVKSLLSCLTAVYASDKQLDRVKYFPMIAEKICKYRDGSCYKYMNGKYKMYLWCFGKFDFVHVCGAKISLWSKNFKKYALRR